MNANTQKVLIAAIVAVTVVIVAFMVIGPRDECERIFEQTTGRFEASLEVINAKGGVVIGKDKVQELTGRSQEIAIQMKCCCVIAGKDYQKFNECLEKVNEQERTLARISALVQDAHEARAQGDDQAFGRDSQQAAALVGDFARQAKALEERVRELEAKVPSQGGGTTPPSGSGTAQPSSGGQGAGASTSEIEEPDAAVVEMPDAGKPDAGLPSPGTADDAGEESPASMPPATGP